MRLADLSFYNSTTPVNPLNAELNPICNLLSLLGAHHILHVGRIRVKVLVRYRRCIPTVEERVVTDRLA